jgi:branched-chain amino acid transport system substrate-binding protein
VKRMIGLCFVLILFGALAGFAADPILIGLQGPITGPWAYEGQMAQQSCEIAAALINQKGGILGGRQV